MSDQYYVLKSILTALELNLVGEALREFVQRSTGCDIHTFHQVYDEVVQAWTK
jgi:hypothetical protein